MTARYEVRDQVAVITLDNPPVNGLGYATRKALAGATLNRRADSITRNGRRRFPAPSAA